MSICTIGIFHSVKDAELAQSEGIQKKMLLRSGTGGLTTEDKVCCNCGNCERRPERGGIETYCAIDNHRIGYVECFTRKCKHWKRETKWDGMEAEDYNAAD